jgi:hypothetical protein
MADMKLEPAALNELANIARQRGALSMENLRQVLPIENMTVDEISDVLARLDEAGIDVEIDPPPLSPAGKAIPREPAPIIKQEEIELSETTPEQKKREQSLPTSRGNSTTDHQMARRAKADASAPMLPWVLAFVIVVFVFFAAFAF